ncbi:MAG: glycosyltransferase family 2 protein [candidate division Zixibacteria bacterium]|nr:glycosyltransferase family 2 protein [candidate division Zixibacteria bacterium]
MATLSVIIITRNEEKNIARALESVKFADQIVICDSYSTDETVAIAERYDCKIIQQEFIGFGPAKQATLEQATGDWVLSLDADEEIDATLQEQIQQAINSNEYDAHRLNRISSFLGRWIKHSGWYPDYLLRLFRREKGSFTSDTVHESVVVNGRIGRLSGHIRHHTDPDITHYLAKLDRYTSLSAQALADRKKAFRCSSLLVKPPAIFIKMYFLRSGWRDGIEGLLLALFSSFHVLCKYARLWELQRR